MKAQLFAKTLPALFHSRESPVLVPGTAVYALDTVDPSDPISSIADEPTAWAEISDPYELVPVESIIGFYISPRCQSSPKLTNLNEKEEN